MVAIRKKHTAIGARPGTIVIHPDAPKPKIHVFKYNDNELDEFDVETAEELETIADDSHVTWIDVQGMGDEKLMLDIARIFSIHPLVIADVVNVPQRPKCEVYGEQMLIVSRMLTSEQGIDVEFEQISFVLSKNFLLTFQEKHGDVLDPVRNRIRNGKSNFPIRMNGCDYLTYALYDTIMDGYFPVLEHIGEYLEHLEVAVIQSPDNAVLTKLNHAKKILSHLRRSIWPQRETISAMMREDGTLINKGVHIYIRDLYDHCIQSTEVTEMYREMVSSLFNTYLSAIANRANDVMKALTIMASIFIPLTFMAGVYGMNFDVMPELKWRYSYPLLLMAMLAVAVLMIYLFHRRGWIFARKHKPKQR